MEIEEARSEATILRYKVHNIKELRHSVLSPPCDIRNLPWKIMVMPRHNPYPDRRLQMFLGFFLQCNGESESTRWSCYAKAELRLISHTPGTNFFSRNIQHLFYSKENDWGFAQFVPWNDLLNPVKGYVKDDAITLEVHITANEPYGIISLDSKNHNGAVEGEVCDSEGNGLNDEDEKARSEATFRFNAHNIKELTTWALSPPCYIRNLPWKIMVMPRYAPGPDRLLYASLGFFLQCNDESVSEDWSCYATAELRLISHKPDTEPFSRKIKHLFHRSFNRFHQYVIDSSKENDWGFLHFIPLVDVIDPETGYLKDDTITLEVYVKAD